jgi:hypothetical protein
LGGMAVHYEFIDDLLKFTYSGDTELDRLSEVWFSALADPAFKRCRKMLIDASLSELNMPAEFIETRTARMARFKQLAKIKWAVVAEKNNLAFGLSRMFSTFAEDIGLNVMVFRDSEQAMAWLSSVNEGDPT